ncbi:MAG: serine/threonine-protein kinase [Gemmatimonadaceae bacterium]
MTAPHPDTASFADALHGQYRLEREIGRGGMGIVYLARDLKLDRAVAIKTLPYHLASDPTIRDRFLREARTAAALTHPSIVPIHRADELGDFVFFVMGYVDGESMAQRIRRAGPYAPAELCALLIEIASALGYAHARGVVHRDVKAENILLDVTGRRAMVTDFGIARLAQSAPLTQTGTVLGTVFYMSPEQVTGDELDGRSDLYSLGVLAFLALTGRFPFESETPSAVLVAHVTKAPPPIRSLAPMVPEPLSTIVDRLLAKDRGARFPDAESVVAALTEAARASPHDAPAASRELLSETEAQAVWERAALLQEMTGQLTPPPVAVRDGRRAPVSETSGYRLDDVRLAARDAGIGEKYVERALAERNVGPADVPDVVREGVAMQVPVNALAGARTKLEFEAIVDGELSDLDLEDVADEIRRSVGDVGNVNTIGRSVTWTSYASPTSQRKLQLSVSTRGGRTVIRGFEDLSQMSGGIFGGITGGVGGGVGGVSFGITMGVTKGAFLIAGPIFAGVVAGAYGLARTIFIRMSRNRERMLRTAVERVAQRVRECIAARQLERSREAPRLRR